MSAPRTPPHWSRLVAGYAAWVALSLAAGWLVSVLVNVILALAMALRASQWVALGLRQLSLPVLGLLWLVFIFWLEARLRSGWRAGAMWPRLGRVAAALALLGALALGAQALLT